MFKTLCMCTYTYHSYPGKILECSVIILEIYLEQGLCAVQLRQAEVNIFTYNIVFNHVSCPLYLFSYKNIQLILVHFKYKTLPKPGTHVC